MRSLQRGRYIARTARNAADLHAVRALRYLCFIASNPESVQDLAKSAISGPLDQDRFDDICRHILIEDIAGGRLVCCFRMLPLDSGKTVDRSYSAQFYELSALARYSGAMSEIGRFCVDPSGSDPDVLRLAWAALSRCVAEDKTGMLFGCSSFSGTDPAEFTDSFALFRERHLAPGRFRPGVKSPDVYLFARNSGSAPDRKQAAKAMPPLLRSYLSIGAWVSDHAVIDRDLGTMHVFTGVELTKIPRVRAQALRDSAR